MIEPVTLSGGNLGGEIVEGNEWQDGEIREIDGLQYRRAGSIAVFCGD